MEKKVKRIIVTIILNGIEFTRSLLLIPHGVCKYYPSCTKYAEIALNKYPVYKAILLIAYRIIRCNPFSKGGFDAI